MVAPFWEGIEKMGRRGDITTPGPVLWDLKVGDDELYQWCNERSDILVTQITEEIDARVSYIANKYKNLGSPDLGGKSHSDLYVVATALYFGSDVVTQEAATRNLNGPKIPDVCKAEGVQSVPLYRFFQEKWKGPAR